MHAAATGKTSTLVEHACADAWPAVTENTLGQWRLRAAGGFTGRANSALAVGDPGVPIAEALGTVREFAAAQAIPPMVQTIRDSAVESAVRGQGWRPNGGHPGGAEVIVLVGPARGAAAPGVRILPEPTPGWWELTLGPGDPDAVRRHVLASPEQTGFGIADAADGTAGAVRGVVVGDLLHVARLAVRPTHRRRGVARALMGGLGGWARRRGATWCALQVSVGNDGALALYRDLGFTEHHRYRYWVPADGDQ